ncbi:hypothetical protein L209DRAFT_342593 [Thermothelomyces heterothallicus CBS 203.75]
MPTVQNSAFIPLASGSRKSLHTGRVSVRSCGASKSISHIRATAYEASSPTHWPVPLSINITRFVSFVDSSTRHFSFRTATHCRDCFQRSRSSHCVRQ